MVAKIEIEGNEGCGYTVKVTLPTAWCKQFIALACVAVHGESLCPTWGVADGDDRVRKHTYGNRQDSEERAEHSRQQILMARDALNQVICHEIEIEL